MTRRALITGAGGFIGSHIAKYLKTLGGRETVGLFRTAPMEGVAEELGLTAWSDRPLTCADLMALPGVFDEIYHCAGNGSVAISMTDPEKDFNCNVLTTQAVLEYARQSGSGRVVLLSSAGVYGKAAELPITVQAECQPISPYGTNKLIAELLATQYARNFGVPVAIVRLFSVYGAGLRKQLLWDGCRKIRAGDLTFFGTGAETRDWIHVRDAARLLVHLADFASETAPVFNGGCGKASTIQDVLEDLSRHMNNDGHINFSGTTRAGDPQHYLADISEAQATGWEARERLDEGLAEYVRWFRSLPEHETSSPFTADQATAGKAKCNT